MYSTHCIEATHFCSVRPLTLQRPPPSPIIQVIQPKDRRKHATLPPWKRCRRLANTRWTPTGFGCSADAYIRCFPAAVRPPWTRFRGRHKSCQHCWTPDCCRGRDGATASDDARDLDSPSAPPLSSSSLSAADLTHKLHIDSPPPQRFLTLTRHIARLRRFSSTTSFAYLG